mgnify:FL=1
MAADDPTPQAQQAARARALAAGYGPEEVDAFIQREGGARTSASRILTAFNQQEGSNPAQSAPDMGGGGAIGGTGGGIASMSALNTVVEPSPTVTSGGSANPALTALSGLTGGGGSVGNQEQTGSVGDTSAGMFRPLGRRNIPEGSLKLSRRTY